MKPWIQNISKANVRTGNHSDPGSNSMLIQICDPPGDFPTPKYKFKEVYKFDFLDIEADGMSNNGLGTMEDMSEFAITDEQAKGIAQALQKAFENNMNVVVHCHAGVCRSGAVVEVGILMGFEDTNVYRSPNALVKNKIIEHLDLPKEYKSPLRSWDSPTEKIKELAKERYKHRKNKK